MKYIKHLIAFCILIALIAGGWSLLGGSDDIRAYRTAKITRGSIAEVVTATGTLNPVQLVDVGTQVSGQVSNVYVHVNDAVKTGQLLAEIDPALLAAQAKQDQSNVETARVNFEQAERDLNRTRMLLEKDYVAKVDLEHAEQTYLQAKNSYDSSKTQLDRDAINLNYAKIYSPIDGVVISQDITLGQTVAATFQTPNMFKIAGDLTQMKIDVSFSESDISKIKAYMPVTFTVDAFPDRVFKGKVQMVNLNPNNQQGVVTYTVVVVAENADKVLLPGMTAYVSTTLSETDDVLRVPASAMRFSPPVHEPSGLQMLFQFAEPPRPMFGADVSSGEKTLYLLRHNTLVPVAVKTGASDDAYVAVSGKDIAEGDTVVTGLMPRKR